MFDLIKSVARGSRGPGEARGLGENHKRFGGM